MFRCLDAFVRVDLGRECGKVAVAQRNYMEFMIFLILEGDS